MTSKQYIVRQKVLCKRNENPEMSYRAISKSLGISKSTVANILNNFHERLTIDRKSGSGRKSGPVCRINEKKVLKNFEQNPNVSVRDVAKKIGVSASYVQKVKKRNGLKTFKVQKAPNRDKKQNFKAKSRARDLYRNFLTKFECVILDDETYVKTDFHQIPGQEFFTCANKFNIEEKYKQKKLSKFAGKFLVWQAICTCGRRSQSFVTKGTMNQEIYLEECLKKRLLPFIRSHTISTLFWPDLATCHYSNKVIQWYEANRVIFVPKNSNPPNCPELRPIEKYWAHVKHELRKTKGRAQNVADFQKK